MAFVASADLLRSRAFYEGALGLRVVVQDDYACVFDADGTVLRVTAVEQVVSGGYTVLGWRVDDIENDVRTLTEAGVAFTRYEGMGQDPAGIWTTPGGDRVAWFCDPDGNTLSLTQYERSHA